MMEKNARMNNGPYLPVRRVDNLHLAVNNNGASVPKNGSVYFLFLLETEVRRSCECEGGMAQLVNACIVHDRKRRQKLQVKEAN